MTIRVAINGYGRIGRAVLRALYERQLDQQIQVVAINELATDESIAHLTQYDSTHGRFFQPVSWQPGELNVGTDRIQLLHEPDLHHLPWLDLGVDLVLDCTGRYHSRAHGEAHLNQGARKVLFSHPADADLDATIIYGINHHILKPHDNIVSNGSCTTNCIIPVIQTLDEAFGIDNGTITTIHAAMNDQQVIDAFHQNLRLTRAAGQSMIPVGTKLQKGIERIYPKFVDRFETTAIRVPTINVTAMDMTVNVRKKVSIDEVNHIIRDISGTKLHNILKYSDAPLVSCDFNHDPHSSILDATQTRVVGQSGTMVKTLTWCDNEWGFANRMLDTGLYMMTEQQ